VSGVKPAPTLPLKIKPTISSHSEFARVFGVDFNSAMTRGSQFKVESFMFRIAKPEAFVLISPSREAVSDVAMWEVVRQER
jgi:DNA polymerase zeta